MIPRVFVSSTIRDLQHIRDAIREMVVELGYQPIMSEHGEIGYLPDIGAADACYREAKDCDLGILIVGKRYGNEHRDGISVTHTEYRTLITERIPIITLVEKDTLTYRNVFDANRENRPANFPGMDQPEKTFGFIEEITRCAENNGIQEFTHIEDARSYIRKQLAHIFGNLLRNKYDPVKGEVKDILAEVRALRNELSKDDQKNATIQFLRVSRSLLDDNQKNFRLFLEALVGRDDNPVKEIINNENLDQLIEKVGWTISVLPTQESFIAEEDRARRANELQIMSRWSDSYRDKERAGTSWYGAFAALNGKRIIINEATIEMFRASFLRCKSAGQNV